MAYRVKRQFMDGRGQRRSPGEPFEADDAEIQKELAAGNLEEVPAEIPPPGTGKDTEGGGAPA